MEVLELAEETQQNNDQGNRRTEARERPQRQQGRYYHRRRVCAFCVDKVETIDYKDVTVFRRYLTDQGKIRGRRQTGTCAKHQRQLSRAIKRARMLALLPYSYQHHFTS